MSKREREGKTFIIPPRAKLYLALSALLLALPTLNTFYKGYEGQFIVSTALTEGTFFERTVLYIEKHDLFEARGYVINRAAAEEGVLIGGPVGQGLYAIHDDTEADHGFKVRLLADLQKDDPRFVERLEAGTLGYPVKVFKGFAGWTVLQLNIEAMRGGWDVLPYDADLMFDTPPEDIWPQARAMLGEDVNFARGERI